jgi:hypothetical protein
MLETIFAVLIALAIAPMIFAILPVVFIVGAVLALTIIAEWLYPPED